MYNGADKFSQRIPAGHTPRTNPDRPNVVTSVQLDALRQLPERLGDLDVYKDIVPRIATDVKTLTQHYAQLLDAHNRLQDTVIGIGDRLDAIHATLQKLVTNNDLWGSINSSVVPAHSSPTPLEPISNGETKSKVVKKITKDKA